MPVKNNLVKGTIILTIAGFATRIIGFFYRIFLSRTIGAESMGIYQLIFPVRSFCFSLCVASIQTSISRYVAMYSANSSSRTNAHRIFIAGTSLSLLLSSITGMFIFTQSNFIAEHIVGEIRCAALIQCMGISIPIGALHSCICGYYLGFKKASISAYAQLIEQCIRVLFVYLAYVTVSANGQPFTPFLAVVGIVIGELASVIYCLFYMGFSFFRHPKKSESVHLLRYKNAYSDIWGMAFPLTLNRVMLSLFQSMESVLIPARLRLYGMSGSDALSIYGILCGMALPFVMFPGAVTNSISVMLLPTVAEANTKGHLHSLASTTEKSIAFTFYMGILCTGIFSTLGNEIGFLMFQNRNAGTFIIILAWLCPFLYLTTTLASILNGLGKTRITFFQNMAAILIRLAFVLFFIPRYGIIGYLWGMLISQLVISFLHFLYVRKFIPISLNATDWILKPGIFIIISLLFSELLCKIIDRIYPIPSIITLCLYAGTTFIVYSVLLKKNLDFI